jgi:hypothetical protein
MKNPKDEMGELSYHDYLIQRGKQYKEKHTKLAEEKSGTATDGCTFKPTILKKKLAGQKEDNKQSDLSKWQELYLMAEKKRAKDKKDRDLDDIELSKNPEEYTFQPNKGKKRSIRAAM